MIADTTVLSGGQATCNNVALHVYQTYLVVSLSNCALKYVASSAISAWVWGLQASLPVFVPL